MRLWKAKAGGIGILLTPGVRQPQSQLRLRAVADDYLEATVGGWSVQLGLLALSLLDSELLPLDPTRARGRCEPCEPCLGPGGTAGVGSKSQFEGSGLGLDTSEITARGTRHWSTLQVVRGTGALCKS